MKTEQQILNRAKEIIKHNGEYGHGYYDALMWALKDSPEEELYKNHINTVLRNREMFKYPADLILAGFKESDFKRAVEELEMDPELFEGLEGFD